MYDSPNSACNECQKTKNAQQKTFLFEIGSYYVTLVDLKLNV